MEISIRKPKIKGKKPGSVQVSDGKLHFYGTQPNGNVTIMDFQACAVERLKILKAVEKFSQKFHPASEEYNTELTREIRNISGPVSRAITRQLCDKSDLDKDVLSHYILRLAYCHTEELRRWFLAQELALFRYRFSNEGKPAIQKFMEDEKLMYNLTSEEEKIQIRQALITCGVRGILLEHTDIYKVPWYQAPELVSRRRCYIQKGFAYVPYKDIITLVLNDYRPRLSKAISKSNRILPHFNNDKRLNKMLAGLSKYYVGEDYSKKPGGEIRAAHVPKLSTISFPLCMQNLNTTLDVSHHLKYFGRMQYGLYLKGIGLPLEESLRFWRTHFTKILDLDKFEKQYAYNIRHNYGKEGKRANYTPYSCMKIISSNVSTGDCHGCPFKHNENDHIVQLLRQRKIPDKNIKEITAMSRAGHFQLACGKVFMNQHSNAAVDFAPNHPNEYFTQSRQILDGKSGFKEKIVPIVVKVEEPPIKIEYVESPSAKLAKLSKPANPQPIKEIDTEDLQNGFFTPGRTHHRVLPSTVPPPPPPPQSTTTPSSSSTTPTSYATPSSKGKYVAPVKQDLPHKGRVFSPRPPIPLADNIRCGVITRPVENKKKKSVTKVTTPVKKVEEEKKETLASEEKLEFTMDDEDDFSLDDLNYIDSMSSQSSQSS